MANDSIPEVLAGYDRFAFTDGPWTRNVYRKGGGPAVIMMHEMPTCTPKSSALPIGWWRRE